MIKLNISKIIDFLYFWKSNIGDELKNVFSLFHFKIYLILFFLLALLNYSFAFYIYKSVSPESRDLVALHYNVDFGVNLIGESSKVFILPSLGLLIIIINVLLLFSIYKQKNSKFLAHLLFITASISNIYLFIGIITIYLVNFR